MSVYCKCANDKCSLRESCYRFIVPDSGPGQSYSDFVPNADNTCDSYVGGYRDLAGKVYRAQHLTPQFNKAKPVIE